MWIADQFIFPSGWMGESRYKGDSSNSPTSGDPQPTCFGDLQRQHDMEPAYQECADWWSWHLHVPSKYGSNASIGKYDNVQSCPGITCLYLTIQVDKWIYVGTCINYRCMVSCVLRYFLQRVTSNELRPFTDNPHMIRL